MTGRLTRTESFRARVWRDLFAQERVRTLPVGAFKLLAGVVFGVLTPFNNGVITLGPRTLARLGLSGRGGPRQALDELIAAGLLMRTSDQSPGAVAHFAVVTLPIVASARASNLTSSGQVNVTSSGQVTPKNLTSSGQDLTSSGQVESDLHIKNARACVRAEEAHEGEQPEMHSHSATRGARSRRGAAKNDGPARHAPPSAAIPAEPNHTQEPA